MNHDNAYCKQYSSISINVIRCWNKNTSYFTQVIKHHINCIEAPLETVNNVTCNNNNTKEHNLEIIKEKIN